MRTIDKNIIKRQSYFSIFSALLFLEIVDGLQTGLHVIEAEKSDFIHQVKHDQEHQDHRNGPQDEQAG